MCPRPSHTREHALGGQDTRLASCVVEGTRYYCVTAEEHTGQSSVAARRGPGAAQQRPVVSQRPFPSCTPMEGLQDPPAPLCPPQKCTGPTFRGVASSKSQSRPSFCPLPCPLHPSQHISQGHGPCGQNTPASSWSSLPTETASNRDHRRSPHGSLFSTILTVTLETSVATGRSHCPLTKTPTPCQMPRGPVSDGLPACPTRLSGALH